MLVINWVPIFCHRERPLANAVPRSPIAPSQDPDRLLDLLVRGEEVVAPEERRELMDWLGESSGRRAELEAGMGVADREESVQAADLIMILLMLLTSGMMAIVMALVWDAILPYVAAGALDPGLIPEVNRTRQDGNSASVPTAADCPADGLDDAAALSIGGVVGVVIMLIMFGLIQLCRHKGWIPERQEGKIIIADVSFKLFFLTFFIQVFPIV